LPENAAEPGDRRCEKLAIEAGIGMDCAGKETQIDRSTCRAQIARQLFGLDDRDEAVC
jgi:hypothetical protein